MYVPYDMSKVKVLDLSQNFSMDSPSFAFYEGPTVKWVKRLAFEGVNAQFISTTNHIATHLDSPIHFYDPGPDIAGIPIDTLVGPACIVDLAGMGIGHATIQLEVEDECEGTNCLDPMPAAASAAPGDPHQGHAHPHHHPH